jgi:hypothetical protein
MPRNQRASRSGDFGYTIRIPEKLALKLERLSRRLGCRFTSSWRLRLDAVYRAARCHMLGER